MCANTTNHLSTSIRKKSRLSLSLLFWRVLRLSPSLFLWQLSFSFLLRRLSPSLLLWWECTSCCVLSLSRDPSVQSLMMARAVSWWSVQTEREREVKWYLCKQSSLQSKFIQPTIVSFPATEPGNECQTMNKRKTFNFQKNSMYMGSIKSKLYPNVLTILASLAKESGVVTLSTLQCTVQQASYVHGSPRSKVNHVTISD